MAGINVPQYEIFKIGTDKLKYSKWNLNIDKKEAFKYQESVSLFEGQQFRIMAKKIINGRMYNTDSTEVQEVGIMGIPVGILVLKNKHFIKRKQVNILFMLMVVHSQILVTVMEDMIALVKNLSRCLWNRLSNGRKNI